MIESASAFPAGDVEARIRAFLTDQASIRDRLHGAKGRRPIPSVGPERGIDSLVMVELLVELEEIVSVKLPQNLIPAGGLDSVEDVVDHLLPAIEKLCLSDEEKRTT